METSKDKVTFKRADGTVEIPDNSVVSGGYILSFKEEISSVGRVTIKDDERTFVFEDISKPLWCENNELHAGKLRVE
jgi:hypothetical protein